MKEHVSALSEGIEEEEEEEGGGGCSLGLGKAWFAGGSFIVII